MRGLPHDPEFTRLSDGSRPVVQRIKIGQRRREHRTDKEVVIDGCQQIVSGCHARDNANPQPSFRGTVHGQHPAPNKRVDELARVRHDSGPVGLSGRRGELTARQIDRIVDCRDHFVGGGYARFIGNRQRLGGWIIRCDGWVTGSNIGGVYVDKVRTGSRGSD